MRHVTAACILSSRSQNRAHEARLLHQRLHAPLARRRAARHPARPGSTASRSSPTCRTRTRRRSTQALTDTVRRTLDETRAGGQQHQLQLHVRLLEGRAAGAVLRAEPDQPEPASTARTARELILKTLDFAKAVGAANISITSGRCLGGMPPDKAARQFAESIKPILDRAERSASTSASSASRGCSSSTSPSCASGSTGSAHPRFGANLDIGHSVVIGENDRRGRSSCSRAASGTCTSRTCPAASTTT